MEIRTGSARYSAKVNMAFNEPVNLQTVYVSCMCLSMKKVFQTKEEADKHASSLKPHRIWGNNFEYGYVIEMKPGDLSVSIFNDRFMCPVDDEDAGNNCGQQSFNYLEIPSWLSMGYLATARPVRKNKK